MSITDEEIIDLIIDGTIVVDLRAATVTCRGRQLKATLMGTEGKNGTRYRFEIRHNGRKRTIVRHKIVYIAATLQVIPEGYELHHIDFNRYNDAFHNLILLTIEDHRKIHGQFDYSKRKVETPF